MNLDTHTTPPPDPGNSPTKAPAWIGAVQAGVIATCFVVGSVQIDPALFPSGNVEGTGWGWGFAALAGFFAGALRGDIKGRRNAWYLFGTGLFIGVLVAGILIARV